MPKGLLKSETENEIEIYVRKNETHIVKMEARVLSNRLSLALLGDLKHVGILKFEK